MKTAKIPFMSVKEIEKKFAVSKEQAVKIKNIYKKGYKICLISNTGFTSPKTYKIYLEKIGLLKKKY